MRLPMSCQFVKVDPVVASRHDNVITRTAAISGFLQGGIVRRKVLGRERLRPRSWLFEHCDRAGLIHKLQLQLA